MESDPNPESSTEEEFSDETSIEEESFCEIMSESSTEEELSWAQVCHELDVMKEHQQRKSRRQRKIIQVPTPVSTDSDEEIPLVNKRQHNSSQQILPTGTPLQVCFKKWFVE